MEELQVDTGRGILLVKNTLLDVQANRRKIPRIGRSPATKAEMDAKSTRPSGNMVNRRKIPRIGPRSANKADAGTDAKSAVKGTSKNSPLNAP